MKRKILCIFIMIINLFIFSALWAVEQNLSIDIQHHSFSAKAKDVPLKFICEKIQKEKGLWFRGNSLLFNERINIQINNIVLEDGLKKILSNMNYAMIYDANKVLEGVILLGRKKAEQVSNQNISNAFQRPVISSIENNQAGLNQHFGTNKKADLPISNEINPMDIENDKQNKFSPSIDASTQVTDKDMQNFKLQQSIDPPGGPVEVKAEESERFRVVRDSLPPGGTVKTSSEELDKFKVIKGISPDK